MDSLTPSRVSAPPSSPTGPSPWRYGEHVSVIGDTGSGKTYLIARLVAQRQYVVFLQTKSDETVEHEYKGFVERRQARSMNNLAESRIILRPKHEDQRVQIGAALDLAWKQGGWTVVVDELLYIEKLKLTWPVDKLLTQGRSEKLSTVVGMQRPVSVTRWAISQSTHIFCFAVEGRDIATIAEATTHRIVGPLSQLQKYQFVYYNRKTRRVAVGTAQTLDQIIVPTRGIY